VVPSTYIPHPALHPLPVPKNLHTTRPQKKMKKLANAAKFQLVAAKVPAVKVSDSDRRNIIVLNVVGLLCDIRSLHDTHSLRGVSKDCDRYRFQKSRWWG
jgi:hypothetical protein